MATKNYSIIEFIIGTKGSTHSIIMKGLAESKARATAERLNEQSIGIEGQPLDTVKSYLVTAN